ncbi:MAG: DUF1554 domain-containing protein [Thermomicrobiales bacterium]|nr:DUF1554 domain-containing protein [Thermomicrobiales bacterium]
MHDIHVAALAQRISASLTRRAGLGLIAASLPLLAVDATDAKKKKITLCVNGKTANKPKKKAKKLLKQGASKGRCRCGNGGPCFAFVTAAAFTGSAITGLAGADASCQEAASVAGLPGTYKAWLSAGGSTPATRFTNTANAGPYVRVTGPLVANSFAELLACPGGTCQASSINEAENGQSRTASPVWTGTKSDGTASPDTCNGWTSDTGQGLVGNTNLVNTQWTDNGTNACSEARPIFCFQQAT